MLSDRKIQKNGEEKILRENKEQKQRHGIEEKEDERRKKGRKAMSRD